MNLRLVMGEQRTDILLNNLIDAIRSNSEVCQQFTASDILACLWADLSDCKMVLEESDYLEFTDRLEFLEVKLDRALKTYNTTEVIEVFEELLGIYSEFPDKDIVEKIVYDLTVERYKEHADIAVIGDSHVNFFSGNELLYFVSIGHGINVSPSKNDLPFTCFHLGPCLAYTSNSKDSSNHFAEKAEYIVSNILKENSKVVVALGEIDIRCHVYKETAKSNKSYQEVVDDILDNYFEFLTGLSQKGFEVYVWGPIASQKDECPVTEMYPRVGSEIERNTATKYFTDEARRRCKDNNLTFMSIFDAMTDPDMHTKAEFLSSDMCHLSQRALPFAKKEWKKINME